MLYGYPFLPGAKVRFSTLFMLTLIYNCQLQPFITVSQSDYLIQIVDINSHTERQTVQIQISWLLQKPTDLDLQCFQKQDISGFSRTRVSIYLAVCCLSAFRKVSGLKSSERSKVSLNKLLFWALSTQVCTATARETRPRRYWIGSSGPSHFSCQFRGVWNRYDVIFNKVCIIIISV